MLGQYVYSLPSPNQVLARAFRFRKKYSDSIFRNELIFRFDSAHHWRIGYYRLLCCQMSTLLRHHESLSQLHKDVGCTVRNTTAEYGTMPWRMIIDQVNAAAESMADFLTKRIDSCKTNLYHTISCLLGLTAMVCVAQYYCCLLYTSPSPRD